MREGKPTYDGTPHEWKEVEGWYVAAPGNMVEYMKWLVEKKRKAAESEVPGE